MQNYTLICWRAEIYELDFVIFAYELQKLRNGGNWIGWESYINAALGNCSYSIHWSCTFANITWTWNMGSLLCNNYRVHLIFLIIHLILLSTIALNKWIIQKKKILSKWIRNRKKVLKDKCSNTIIEWMLWYYVKHKSAKEKRV